MSNAKIWHQRTREDVSKAKTAPCCSFRANGHAARAAMAQLRRAMAACRRGAGGKGRVARRCSGRVPMAGVPCALARTNPCERMDDNRLPRPAGDDGGNRCRSGAHRGYTGGCASASASWRDLAHAAQSFGPPSCANTLFNRPLPIGWEKTISQLHRRPDDRHAESGTGDVVLEIGAGAVTGRHIGRARERCTR